jgi:uncharacterized protein YeeX (DUF496 family)
MIIKSMSRKHPSFAQLIDYIEGEAKLKSRAFSIHHNTYSRHKEDLKREFDDNARHLRQRKNGVYLYHEVLSITRSHTLTDEEQKTILKQIVESYLAARGKRNLAYAVLHEDTDNLHFHIVMSANEVGAIERKRLSKAQFADIQTRLESWVLKEYPELEQKAVFHKNQTTAERAEREAKRQHLSNKGEEMKRRGAKTEKRDQVQEPLTDIFETATDPRHFAELMERAGFALYTRGKTHGITDREGNKYRLNRLGLVDEWERLDERMKSYFHAERATQDENTNHEAKPTTETTTAGPRAEKQADRTSSHTPEQDPIQTEAEKRLAEMKAIRAKRAAKQQAQTKRQDRER